MKKIWRNSVGNVKEYEGRNPPTQVVKRGVGLGIIHGPSSYIRVEKFRALSLYVG